MIVCVSVVWITRIEVSCGGWGEGAIVGEKGPEEEVLDDGEFAEYLGEIHFEHAGIDLVPCFDLREMEIKGDCNRVNGNG